MGEPTFGSRPETRCDGIVRGNATHGAMRPLAAYSVFATDLPITDEEIHKVLVALGPDLAALFEELG